MYRNTEIYWHQNNCFENTKNILVTETCVANIGPNVSDKLIGII